MNNLRIFSRKGDLKTKLNLKLSTIFMKILCAAILSLSTAAIMLFACCKNSNGPKSHNENYKEVYITQFKLTYLRSLLIKSYNNSNDIQTIINLDKSGFTEPILTTYDYRLIDSLTRADNTKLTIDSANSIGRVAEGAEGKHILKCVIDKIESKWLDSLASRRYVYAKVDEQFPE
jgi:hypothetical protein